jgi:hypothetical protein
MAWNLRTISIAVLLAFSLVPFLGTFCAIVCDTGAQAEAAGHHHGAVADSREASPPDVARIAGSSAHRCGHDAAIQQATTTAPQRAPSVFPAPLATVVAVERFAMLPVQRSAQGPDGAPPGSTRPTPIPLVLRV